MSRRIRFIPEGGALVEVTCRALQSRLLFRPSPVLNQIIIGTLARAKKRHDKVRVCFFVGLSNHMLCAALHNMCYRDFSSSKRVAPIRHLFGAHLFGRSMSKRVLPVGDKSVEN